MKKLLLLFFPFALSVLLQAQVTKTVYSTAGTLSVKLTDKELTTVTNLIITGVIDARDFSTMRDEMKLLKSIDLSNATISDYKGINGTVNFNTKYPANEIPVNAFIKNDVSKTSLTTIILPNSVTTVGVYAFSNCKGLTGINLPNSVTSIGDGAFQGCTGLTGKLIIPDSVISIKNCAFQGCNKLTGLTISNSVTFIGDQAFGGCSGLSSLTIPNSVTSIGQSAFIVCTRLTYLSLSNSVTFIGTQAFWGCIGLTSIYANSVLPINLSASLYVFTNVNKATCILYVPVNSKKYYAAMNQWQDFSNIVESPALN